MDVNINERIFVRGIIGDLVKKRKPSKVRFVDAVNHIYGGASLAFTKCAAYMR